MIIDFKKKVEKKNQNKSDLQICVLVKYFDQFVNF